MTCMRKTMKISRRIINTEKNSIDERKCFIALFPRNALSVVHTSKSSFVLHLTSQSYLCNVNSESIESLKNDSGLFIWRYHVWEIIHLSM